MQDFLKINDTDNVVVALNTSPAGEKITVSVGDGSKTVTAREEIPAGHKMAICDIPEGGEVIKYGYRIGNAKENIAEGSWIHTHNVKTALGDLLEYTYNPTPVEEKKTEDVTFMGFNRPERLADVMCAMRDNDIEPKYLRFVSKSPSDAPWLFLIEGRKGGGSFMQVLPQLYISGSGGISPELAQIYGKTDERTE